MASYGDSSCYYFGSPTAGPSWTSTLQASQTVEAENSSVQSMYSCSLKFVVQHQYCLRAAAFITPSYKFQLVVFQALHLHHRLGVEYIVTTYHDQWIGCNCQHSPVSQRGVWGSHRWSAAITSSGRPSSSTWITHISQAAFHHHMTKVFRAFNTACYLDSRRSPVSKLQIDCTEQKCMRTGGTIRTMGG